MPNTTIDPKKVANAIDHINESMHNMVSRVLISGMFLSGFTFAFMITLYASYINCFISHLFVSGCFNISCGFGDSNDTVFIGSSGLYFWFWLLHVVQ